MSDDGWTSIADHDEFDARARSAPQRDSSRRAAGDHGPAADSRKTIVATPFTWRIPSAIQPREWLYGRHYIRRYVSTTIAPPGVGKTTLGTGEGLAIASGKPLLGISPAERGRVWMWNGEDPIDECERRVAAACIQYGLAQQDVEGWLFLDSGRDTEIIIATTTREGTRISTPVVDDVIAAIRDNRIDAVTIDPFVSSHRVSENDNGAIDAVAKKWAHIAEVTGCAIDLVHHARKTGGEEVTVEDARGGSALLGAVRSARVLNRMTEAEAKKAGVDEHRGYFRVNSGKVNMAPNPSKATWFQLVSVELGNGSERYPSGDHVAVAIPWAWPDLMENVAVGDLLKVQREVDAAEKAGNPWRAATAASRWVGKCIAAVLGADLTTPEGDAKVKSALRAWQKSGALKIEDRLDEHRKPKPCIVVGEWATDPE